jgi:hypothetical protein
MGKGIKKNMTIDDIYKKRLESLKKNNHAPTLILVTEEERNALILETKLLSKEQSSNVSNIDYVEFHKDNTFRLFNIRISTKERENIV